MSELSEQLLEQSKQENTRLNGELNRLKGSSEDQIKENKTINKRLDVIRKLTMLATAVVMAMLIVLWLFTHPGFETLTHGAKTPILAGLFVVCLAYIVALEVGKGSSAVVMFLVFSGFGVSAFALGFATAELRHYLV